MATTRQGQEVNEPWPSLLKYGFASKVTSKPATSPKNGKGPIPSGEHKTSIAQTEDILNAILPARTWIEGSDTWAQNVASSPATRLDVITLQEKLDQQLQHRQARESGICPVREELYAQCFDELIRQATVNCAERGLLLLRVRDEMRMTVAAYQTLYETSIAFGLRKAVQAEVGKASLETQVQKLEETGKDLDRQVVEWKNKCEVNEKRDAEQKQYEDRKRAEEIAYFTRSNKQLKAQLEAFLAPPTKKG